MSTNFALSPAQQQVLALIAEGFTATAAAAQAGVHRNTVANWLRCEEFRAALDQARADKELLYRDEAEALAAEALAGLRSIANDPDTQAGARIRAFRTMLEHARFLMPANSSLAMPMHNDAQLPERSEEGRSHEPPATHNDAQLPERSEVQTLTPDPRPLTPAAHGRPKVGRNELCPCGSGTKFKRCCLGKPVAA